MPPTLIGQVIDDLGGTFSQQLDLADGPDGRKCGELYRKGNNVLYGYLNKGKARLWLRRS